MNSKIHCVSQETPSDNSTARFLSAWRDGVELAGPSLFGCQARSPQDATHWRQLVPMLDVMRKKLPNRSQAEAVFAASLAAFYNAEEGHKLMKKAGCEAFGNLATLLDPRRRAILAVLLANYRGW